MNILGFNRVNKIYSKVSSCDGPEFSRAILDHLRISVDCLETELESIPKEGPLILTSNHPFGGIEGLILFYKISQVRPDIKLLSNFILDKIPNLRDYMFSVNPFTDNKSIKSSSIAGLKGAFKHVTEGGCLLLFPAGEVSTYYGDDFTHDKHWMPSMCKFIKKSGAPVVPIYVDGQNSKFFHIIGKIHPILRSIRLPREVLNKKKHTITFRIGLNIPAFEIANFKDNDQLSDYLRARTYSLEANIERAKPICSGLHIEPIQNTIPPRLLQKELNSLPKEALLFTSMNYKGYLADYDQIPKMIHQLGVKREETFRAVGEGTNLSIDLDKYDAYYKHLILWDYEKKALVGAYRFGLGKEIIPRLGIEGFYNSTLFRFNPNHQEYLVNSIELGRSFITLDYQKDNYALLTLLKGLMYSVIRFKDYKYLFGPVSISNDFPLFYKSLMVKYLKDHYSDHSPFSDIGCRSPFIASTLRVNPEHLFPERMDSLEKYDKLIQRISNKKYRFPPLIKKYVKFGAKFITFNVDKLFNNSLDGLIFVDIDKIPKCEIDALTRNTSKDERINQRFKHGQDTNN